MTETKKETGGMPERVFLSAPETRGRQVMVEGEAEHEYIRADISAAVVTELANLKARTESVTDNPMRPKTEAAISGAMALGRDGGMRPDSGHWLEPWHERGAEFAALEKERDETRAEVARLQAEIAQESDQEWETLGTGQTEALALIDAFRNVQGGGNG
jgi:hypothetical protein